MASLDRAVIVPGTTRATALLEVKTTSDRAARLSDDELADRYRLQVQWYLGVTGLPVARLAVLVGGQELRDFHVNAEPADYQELCDAVDGFWHGHVMAGVAPDLVPADADATRAIPADPDAPPAVASDELLGFIEARRVALERAKLYTAEAKYVQGVIQAAMGEATELVAPDGQRLFTWRPVRTTTTNWEALLKDHPEVAELAAGYRTTTTSRRLSPVKPKDEDA
jgi:predicted phage-related endonuclease